jgi:hypothetical protein
LGQDQLTQSAVIGIIDFYGLRTVSEEQIRAVLGIEEGDTLHFDRDSSGADLKRRLAEIPGVTRAELAAICCEAGQFVLFVGIEETPGVRIEYHPQPVGEISLPREVVETYREFLDAMAAAVRSGDVADDFSQGHSLMQNPAVRQVQKQFLVYAVRHLATLRQVLRSSADSEQRKIAAHVIGYAQDKRDVVDDLQYAVLDADKGVRNNASRALGAIAVLAQRRPELGIEIDPDPLIDMLNSLDWTDRNKAVMVLITMTGSRDARMLEQLRQRALPSLIDMARWKSSWALGAYGILGRMSGLSDDELQDAWEKGERERIIAKVIQSQQPES